MTTVAELREFLEQFDDDVEVDVVVNDPGDDRGHEESLDLEFAGNWDYTDFTNTRGPVHPHLNGRRILTLGES